jgi:plasmid stability protein
MGEIILRDVEDSLVQELRRSAERHGRSLEEELREILRRATGRAKAEALATAERIRAGAPVQTTDSTDFIRQDRDNR